jgi:hypothetical protein
MEFTSGPNVQVSISSPPKVKNEKMGIREEKRLEEQEICQIQFAERGRQYN